MCILILAVWVYVCSIESHAAIPGTDAPGAGSNISARPPPTTIIKPSLIPAANATPANAPEATGTARPDTARVIFTFDDGPESDYVLAYPILKKYGIRGTSYILPKFMDKGMDWKLTWDQVKEMKKYGWVFGCHTYDHVRLAGMPDATIQKSMEAADASFARQGLEPPEIIAYPYGSYNQRVIDAIKPYRKQGRLAYHRTDFVDEVNRDPYRIPSISADMRSTSELKKLERLVDKACAEKAVVVFRVHTLFRNKPYDTVRRVTNVLSGCAPQTSSKLFEELVRYCISDGCSFMTMAELASSYP